MKFTKSIWANLILPVLVGVIVAYWSTFQQKFIAFLVAAVFTALIGDLVLMYPKISGYIKRRAKTMEPKKISLASNPIVDNRISLKLCTKAYIFIRRIEIGMKDKWLIIHPDPFSLDAGKCKQIEFVKLYKPLEYYSLVEMHEENENSFRRFRQGIHSFDVHVGFKFSKNGADYDRFWHTIIDYTESGQITVEIEDVK
jgi:hypothetical protein